MVLYLIFHCFQFGIMLSFAFLKSGTFCKFLPCFFVRLCAYEECIFFSKVSWCPTLISSQTEITSSRKYYGCYARSRSIFQIQKPGPNPNICASLRFKICNLMTNICLCFMSAIFQIFMHCHHNWQNHDIAPYMFTRMYYSILFLTPDRR